jgi:hypothetical protein
MLKRSCAVALLSAAGTLAIAQTDRHVYSPGSNLERIELATLDSAMQTVDVAMYSFTDRETAAELAVLLVEVCV